VGGPIYIILFGLVFFGIGAGLTYKQRTFERQGAQAQGEVTGLQTNCDNDGCTYTPVVRFTTHAGESISFASSYSSNPPAYDIGESVIVIYSLEDPDKAVIKGQGQLFRIIFMIVGGAVIIFGLAIFSSNIKNSVFSNPDTFS